MTLGHVKDKLGWSLLGWVLLMALLFALAGEFFYQLPVFRARGEMTFTEKSVGAKGFVYKDGAYTSEKGGGSLVITLPESFVDKFHYEYVYQGRLEAKVILGDYGVEHSSPKDIIEDHNSRILSFSTVNIHKKTGKITLRFPKETGSLTITSLTVKNHPSPSPVRMLFWAICGSSLGFLLLAWRGSYKLKAEMAFAYLAAAIGLLFLLALPVQKIGLDEEIHFGRAYYFFQTLSLRESVTVTPLMNDMITASENNWPDNHSQAVEEEKAERAYFNTHLPWNSQQPSNDYQQDNYKIRLYTPSYALQGLLLGLGRLLRQPFSRTFAMGRMGNLILYLLVIFGAIRKTPVGKRLMLVMALMPTAMFSAVTFTYDTTVTAFTFYGLACLMAELVDDGRKLSKKNMLLAVLAFLLASLPKPVYIPLLGLAFFVPESKFEDPAVRKRWRAVVGGLCLFLLAAIAAGPILNPHAAGDARGGATSVGQQLRFIFAHPLGYSQLLVTSLRDKFFSFTLGYKGLGQMGHLKGNTDVVAPAVLAVACLLTDRRPEEEKYLTRQQRAAGLILGFMVICLIWTSLYLSFTPVGAEVIRGVQGRYYLPVTLYAAMMLRPEKLVNRMDRQKDLVLVTGASAGLLLYTVYYNLLIWTF